MSLCFQQGESARSAATARHGDGLKVILGSGAIQGEAAAAAAAAVPTPRTNIKPKSASAPKPPYIELDEPDCFEATEVHSFEDYHPVHFHAGVRHPGHLVQSASLSNVDPPTIIYKLSLPDFVSPPLSLSEPTLSLYPLSHHCLCLSVCPTNSFLFR
jgi:hypothetical protein